METQSNIPVLSVQPDSLDFGLIDPKNTIDNPPQSIFIKNSGGGVLAGEIIPQVKWVEVSPTTFNLLSQRDQPAYDPGLIASSPNLDEEISSFQPDSYCYQQCRSANTCRAVLCNE